MSADVSEQPKTAWAVREDGFFARKLYWWDQLPAQLQYNKYIRSGYRAGLTRGQCLCSLLQYHNETGNIHIHLWPVLLLSAALCSHYVEPWPFAWLAFWECVAPMIICLSGSVIYHTLMAHHWQYKQYLLIDVCGVFLILVTGAGTGMFWGLQCYPKICAAFITSYYVAAVVCVIVGMKARTPVGRALPMVGLLAIRGGAVLARLVIPTGSRKAGFFYTAMEVSAVLGATINVARIPEKLLFPKQGPDPRHRKPGLFDYWLNSHQIMHILVLCSMAFKYAGLQEDYHYRLEQRVSCPY